MSLNIKKEMKKLRTKIELQNQKHNYNQYKTQKYQ